MAPALRRRGALQGQLDPQARAVDELQRDQTLASLQRIAALLDERKAQLWINHDKPQSATLRYAPAFYE